MEGQIKSARPAVNRVAIGESLAVLFCPAPNGKVFGVTVDIEDLPRILGRGFWQVHNFTCSRPGHFALYAFRNKRGGGAELLHRFLMDAEPGTFIDHQDHRTLDDRKAGLRKATRAQNAQNARTRKDNKTGLKGVTPDTRFKTFRARIWIGGKRVHLGVFPTPELAAAAYDNAARQHHGEFAFTNGVTA